MNEKLAVILVILAGLAAAACLLVVLVGLALVLPASTRSRGGRLLLAGGVGLLVFAGTCLVVLPVVAG